MGAPTPYIGCLEAHPLGATMAKRKSKSSKRSRRTFTKEFKQEAVQMVLDGHSAPSLSKNLGIGNTNLIYRWKAEYVLRRHSAIDYLSPTSFENTLDH